VGVRASWFIGDGARCALATYTAAWARISLCKSAAVVIHSTFGIHRGCGNTQTGIRQKL
jgi:hypothetical protein